MTAEQNTPEPTDLSMPERLSAMRRIILTQVFGVLGMQSFENGILLLYMTILGISPVRIIVYLSLPNGLSMILRLPVAYFADRFGKKRLGTVGVFLCVMGYACFPLAGFLPAEKLGQAELLILGGIVILAMGKMIFAASWLALMSGVVPEEMRGRFFGKQRLCYQVAGILFAGICSWLLAKNSPIELFQGILFFLTFGFLMRAILYRGVPEVETSRPKQAGFWTALGTVLRAPGYASFCSYIFLLSLFTFGCRNIFSLIEKHVMQLSGGQVVLLANLSMIGAIVGFFIGGRCIDRFGTKYVFLICHFTFGASILGFLTRNMGLLPPVYVVGLMHFILGLVAAASSIAISTETLALIPAENKSLSTSMSTSMMLGGGALSGLVAAGILNSGILCDSWQLWGTTLSNYDAILAAYGGMILLMVVTLGLVPSVLRKAEWIPRSQ